MGSFLICEDGSVCRRRNESSSPRIKKVLYSWLISAMPIGKSDDLCSSNSQAGVLDINKKCMPAIALPGFWLHSSFLSDLTR